MSWIQLPGGMWTNTAGDPYDPSNYMTDDQFQAAFQQSNPNPTWLQNNLGVSESGMIVEDPTWQPAESSMHFVSNTQPTTGQTIDAGEYGTFSSPFWQNRYDPATTHWSQVIKDLGQGGMPSLAVMQELAGSGFLNRFPSFANDPAAQEWLGVQLAQMQDAEDTAGNQADLGVLSVLAAPLLGVAGALPGGAVTGGAIAGGLAAGGSAAIQGENIGEGALQGALVGGATGAAGYYGGQLLGLTPGTPTPVTESSPTLSAAPVEAATNPGFAFPTTGDTPSMFLQQPANLRDSLNQLYMQHQGRVADPSELDAWLQSGITDPAQAAPYISAPTPSAEQPFSYPTTGDTPSTFQGGLQNLLSETPPTFDPASGAGEFNTEFAPPDPLLDPYYDYAGPPTTGGEPTLGPQGTGPTGLTGANALAAGTAATGATSLPDGGSSADGGGSLAPTSGGGVAPGGTNGSPLSNLLGLDPNLISVLGGLGAAGLGVYGANQQANALESIANKEDARIREMMGFGAPYRQRLSDLYANPSAYLSSPEVTIPVQQGTDALARALSVKGNPAGSGAALQELQNYASNQLFGRLGQEKDRLGGFGGLTQYAGGAAGGPNLSPSMGAVNAQGGAYDAIGYGLGQITQPRRRSLQDLLSLA